MKEPNQTTNQFSRFIETVRALGCDEDKEKFEAQLGKIAGHKPAKGAPSVENLRASGKTHQLQKKK